MSVAVRLKKVRNSLGKGQKEMAELLGVNYRTYQNYENALNAPNWDACESLVRLGVNANWLLTGEGEMQQGTAGGEAESGTGGFAPRLSPEVAELAALLENYGNKALRADLKAKLLRMKGTVEGV